MENQNIDKENSAEKKANASVFNDVYVGTAVSMDELIEQFPYYGKLLHDFKEGNGTVELRKRYMLKAIDEAWVRAVEDTIPALDTIIRHPGMSLRENEKVEPIEQTRKVTGRSIQHLSQHTDLINEIRDDGTVMPSKLLNVYQDETMLTYENRFLNTLLVRLYAFVALRYDSACACGEDEKKTDFDFEQQFTHGEQSGKIHLTIEVSEKPHEHEVVKNYIYTTDLWHRVQRIYKIVTVYMNSDFVRQMQKNYVRPPIMRTNMLLKNVNFRQCLSLWEFLDQYENTGYETLIHESLEKVDEICLREFCDTIAMQYVVFRKHIRNGYDADEVLDERGPDEVIKPKFVDELEQFDESEYDQPADIKDDVVQLADLLEPKKQIEEAILVALDADDFFIAAQAAENAIYYKYKHSFLSRLIRAQNPTQDFYTELKNDLLSYKKVKSRISWNHESFTLGREKCARINVKGKTVCLYLPLDPLAYAETKYRPVDASEEKRNEDMPFLLKIRSARSVKYAKELIAEVMQKCNAERSLLPEIKDYHLPYESTEELARRIPPLVKIQAGRKRFLPPKNDAKIDEVAQDGNSDKADGD